MPSHRQKVAINKDNALELDVGDWVVVRGSHFRLSELKLVLDGAPSIDFKHTSELVEKKTLGFAPLKKD